MVKLHFIPYVKCILSLYIFLYTTGYGNSECFTGCDYNTITVGLHSICKFHFIHMYKCILSLQTYIYFCLCSVFNIGGISRCDYNTVTMGLHFICKFHILSQVSMYFSTVYLYMLFCISLHEVNTRWIYSAINEMDIVESHDSALQSYTGPGTTWVIEMNVLNHAPGVKSIAKSVGLQSSALPLGLV